MTDKELIDAFVSGELDEAGMAQLEAELRANPDLIRELADQQQIEQALDVLLGDDTADQQVTVSVLSVLRADPLDSFKKDLLAEVKQEAEIRRREEQAAKIPVAPVVPPAPVEAKPVIDRIMMLPRQTPGAHAVWRRHRQAARRVHHACPPPRRAPFPTPRSNPPCGRSTGDGR